MTTGNVELVRASYDDWARGDFSSFGWAGPDIEFVLADGPNPGSWKRLAAMARAWQEAIGPFVGLGV